MNEEIKGTFREMKDVYLKLFNLIFDSGCYPVAWAEGLIIPIYKKKGSRNDANNYRGITLISCMAKFFSIVLNNRLKVISDQIISEIQAGFRAGFCTMDHIFTLMCIMGLYKKYKENLFIAFIDYQKAFDTIWRAGLWNKLVKEGVKGKFLNIIKDMYKKSKSCVFLNNKKSGSFASYAGVRQGEILSPLLFAFYINDLENFMKSKEILPLTALKDISVDVSNLIDPEWDIYLELLTLFYADDTIIFAETAYSLQLALDELKNYCTDWKLTVNEDKTKIMCVTVKRTEEPHFFYNGKKLEVVEEFTYLGVNFTKKGISNKSVSARILPTQKAMFSTLNKRKAANLPIDLKLDLFT